MSDDSAPPIAEAPENVVLTPEEASAFTDHINRKAISPTDACPVCGSAANFVVREVYRLPVATTQVVVGGEYQPLLTTVCHGCGFVRLFNKIIVDQLIALEKRKAEGDIAPELDLGR